MENFASKEATVQALLSLGFVAVEEGGFFYDSPKEDAWGMPHVQAYVYQCANGYWCVELNGAAVFNSPIVWNGPKAHWDTSDTLQGFVQYLDKNYPGWR